MATEKLPKQIEDCLLPDENVIAIATESRIKNPVTPNTIVATDRRLIVLEPTMGGLKHNLQDWLYEDIQNVKHKSGLIFSGVSFDTRFGQDFNFENIEKADAKNIVNAARNMITKAKSRGSTTDISKPVSAMESDEDDPIKIAKTRFAKGEISKEELADILEMLSD